MSSDSGQQRTVLQRLVTPALLICALLLSASPHSLAATDSIAVAGSTTLQPVLERIAREFMKDHSGLPVQVEGGGSGYGIAALLRGEMDIASSSRFIVEDELVLATRGGIYPVPFRIADDCIIPISHKSNRIKNLRLEDLKRIYSGEVTNWKELGGADQAVKVFSRGGDSGTFGVWDDVVMQQEALAAVVVGKDSSAEIVRAVSATRGAIGYISLGHLSASVKPLRVDGVMGSIYSVREGNYALSRPLFMFTRGWPEIGTLRFINYALNPDKGQSIIQKMGFIPLHTHKKN